MQTKYAKSIELLTDVLGKIMFWNDVNIFMIISVYGYEHVI